MAYIDQFFEVLVNAGASDLHLAPRTAAENPPARRGHFAIRNEEVLTHDEMAYLMSEICGPDRWQRFEEGGDLDFRLRDG